MAGVSCDRVSTVDQALDGQLARLTAERREIIHLEKVSGGSHEGRPELATVIVILRADDELVVARLGHDIRDVLNIIHEVEQRRACITVLDPGVSRAALWGT